jgi:hypothetical protein
LIPWKIYILCVFNSINIIVTDIEGNIRIYRLPSGRGTDHEIDHIIFTGPYHDHWAVCIFCYCPPYFMFFLIELLQFQICPQRLEYILLLIHVKITRYLGDSRSNIILELLYLHVLWNIKDLKWCPTTDYHAIKLWYNYIIVTNMEGNIRIYRLLKGRGTDQWKWCDLFHGPYHDPRAVCISWYCPLYQ